MAKTNSKTKPQQPHPHHVPLAMVFMIAIVFILTLALIFVWNLFPHVPAYVPPVISSTSTIPTVPAIPTSTTPTTMDCGAHGHSNGTVCLCGGIAGWSCPVDQECGDMMPTPTTPDAMGSCHPKPVSARTAPAGMICDATNSICVDPSFAKDTLTSPFVASGTAIAFENTFAWKLLDGSGNVLDHGTVTTNPADAGQPGTYQMREFLLTVPKTSAGTLELLEYSAKDGAEIHVVKIPVKLPTTAMKSRFYMPISSGTNDCSAVSSVEINVVKSGLPVETALRALLAIGPTMSSMRSAIPPDTHLVSLVVNKGTATVVLSSELQNYGGGSCNVSAIRAQIEQTLKQFSSVNNVVISQVGKTPAETLQP